MFLIIFLQVIPPQTGFEKYGPIGICCALFAAAIIYQEKRRIKREDDVKQENQELKKLITELRNEFNQYKETDQIELKKIIAENTHVMNKVCRMIDKSTHN